LHAGRRHGPLPQVPQTLDTASDSETAQTTNMNAIKSAQLIRIQGVYSRHRSPAVQSDQYTKYNILADPRYS
jgi:hypothetical protein